MDQIDLSTLECDTAALIATCKRLKQQNHQLQQQRDQLLWDKQHCADRIKALLQQLNTLETTS